MITKAFFIIACLLAPTTAVLAEDLDDLADSVGKVIGSEEGCGLTYDQSAIEAFITKNVPPSDSSFLENMEMAADVAKLDFKDMTNSKKTARCVLVKRMAEHYGFLK